MGSLCIQIQFEIAPELDMTRVRKIAEDVASDKTLVSNFSIDFSNDKGVYSNLVFETAQKEKLWRLLQSAMYNDENVGPSLSRSTIVTCDGSDGWDNYLLLYHFDASLKLDNFSSSV